MTTSSFIQKVMDTALAQKVAYTAGGLPEYVGEAAPGTAAASTQWRIKKMIYVGSNVTEILWADGDGNFDNAWTGYAAKSYS